MEYLVSFPFFNYNRAISAFHPEAEILKSHIPELPLEHAGKLVGVRDWRVLFVSHPVT